MPRGRPRKVQKAGRPDTPERWDDEATLLRKAEYAEAKFAEAVAEEQRLERELHAAETGGQDLFHQKAVKRLTPQVNMAAYYREKAELRAHVARVAYEQHRKRAGDALLADLNAGRVPAALVLDLVHVAAALRARVESLEREIESIRSTVVAPATIAAFCAPLLHEPQREAFRQIVGELSIRLSAIPTAASRNGRGTLTLDRLIEALERTPTTPAGLTLPSGGKSKPAKREEEPAVEAMRTPEAQTERGGPHPPDPSAPASAVDLPVEEGAPS